MDPLQFTLQTCEPQNSSAQFLSSVLNTLWSHILAGRSSSCFYLHEQLILLILDFLTSRPQRVLLSSILSDLYFTSTGSTKPCVLSPVLLILYTNDCRSTQTNHHLVTTDNTILLYSHGPHDTTHQFWWTALVWKFTSARPKRMWDLFKYAEGSGSSSHQHKTWIQNKYLGTNFDCQLKFPYNKMFKMSTVAITSEETSFDVSRNNLHNFYYSFTESIITFSITRWFYSTSIQNRKQLKSAVTVL